MTVSSRARFICRFHVAFTAAILLCCSSGFRPVAAAQRPGAVRTIQIRWEEPFPGALFSADIGRLSVTRAVFAAAPGKSRSPGLESWRLFFTVEANGTRNLWQAVPEMKSDAAATVTGNMPNLRDVVWSAKPLTRFIVPYFADEASPTPDGRALLFTTNAELPNPEVRKVAAVENASGSSQIARLELSSGRISALTTAPGRNSSPRVSPDGQRFAYVGERSGMDSIFVRSMDGNAARRVVMLARNPVWLDNGMLLIENTRPGQTGLYQLPVARSLTNNRDWPEAPHPRLLFLNGGEVAVAQEGRVLCATAATDARRGAAGGVGRQLYMLASDGSGARSILGTAGARFPNFSPDGQLLVFDAPVPDDGTPKPKGAEAVEAERTLWLVPMVRVLPAVQLLQVRPLLSFGQVVPGEVEVLGTAFAEGVGALEARLEYSLAAEPQRWRSIPMNQLPIHGGILANWRPPSDGDWLLRLTVVDAAGDSAENTLALTWPLPAPPVHATAPPAYTPPVELPPTTPLPATPSVPILPLPALPPAPGQGTSPGLKPPPTRVPPTRIPPLGNPTPAPARTPAPTVGSPVPILPLPALPPAPVEVLPGTPVAAPTAPPTSPTTDTTPVFPDMSTDVPPPVQRRTPPAKATAKPSTVRRPTVANSDSGTIRISGTPATLGAGEKVAVEAVITNRGKAGWGVRGALPVRLIYYWVNLDTGTRLRWYIEWLKQPVAPGASLKMSFDLKAPPRGGRYQLSYVLVRLQSDIYEAPEFDARPARWPGEFAATTYQVTVR